MKPKSIAGQFLWSLKLVLLVGLFLGIMSPPDSLLAESTPGDCKELRVGLIAYDKSRETVARYQRLFQDLSTNSAYAALQFCPSPKIAVGTYAEVLDWVDRGVVDLAVVTSVVFAETKAGGNPDPQAADCLYVVTQCSAPAGPSSFANEVLKSEANALHSRSNFNAVCLVAQWSSITNWNDIVRLTKEGKVEFVFVDPLSASGAILPMHLLLKHGVDFHNHMHFTFGHVDSEDYLMHANPPETNRVVFVHDMAFESSRKFVRTVDVPLPASELKPGIANMSDVLLPNDIWVARKDFDQENEGRIAQLRALLRTNFIVTNGQAYAGFCDDSAELSRQARQLRDWSREVRTDLSQHIVGGAPSNLLSSARAPIAFDEVVSLIRKYEHTRGKPARVALVLSGGGAKCAYQAGAVAFMEQRLKQQPLIQTADVSTNIDINLVVGTSGGALNALPIAAGITSHLEFASRLSNTWTKLDAMSMIRPPGTIQFSLGLLLTFTCFVLAGWFVRGIHWCFTKLGRRGSRVFWQSIVAAALILPPVILWLLLRYPGVSLRNLFHTSKGCFYALLFVNWSLSWTAPLLILCAVVVLATSPVKVILHRTKFQKIRRKFAGRADPRRRLDPFEVVIMFALLLFNGWYITHGPPSLFQAEPLSAAVTARYTEVFGHLVGPEFQRLDERQRLQAISLAIYTNARPRDLVITGSSLGTNSMGAKYFWLRANPVLSSSGLPSFGNRGFQIGRDVDPELLVDVTLGSGTIFPMFPSRSVHGNRRMPDMELIDGGYTHNSPIEAAVAWGATHIILIEASPETKWRGDSRGTFGENAETAVNYLYDQAQLADVSAREKVTIFTLRPTPPLIKTDVSVLDFHPAYTSDQYCLGYDDASSQRYIRQPANPEFETNSIPMTAGR